jgi:hypothetical protein
MIQQQRDVTKQDGVLDFLLHNNYVIGLCMI